MKDCLEGSSRNSSTNRCIKDCKDTQERNSKGKCIADKEMMRMKKAEKKEKALLKKHIAILKKAEKKEKERLKKQAAKKRADDKKKRDKQRADDKKKRDKQRADDKKERDNKKSVTRPAQNNTRIPSVVPPTSPPHVTPPVAPMNDDNVPAQGCEISVKQVQTFSKILGVKYENVQSTCKFLSNVLKLPTDTVLTKFMAVGSSGLIIAAETPSGESYIAKILNIRNDKRVMKRVRDLIKGAPNWPSTTDDEMEREIKAHLEIVELHKEKNLFGDIKGAYIPTIKVHHTVKLKGGTFGVIVMERIKGVTLDSILYSTQFIEEEADRNIHLFKKHASMIGRLHGKGVSHGDPHSENVIVLDGTYDDMAIIDFGRSIIFTERFKNHEWYGTIQHPDTRHIIQDPNLNFNGLTDATNLRIYDIYQVMMPILFSRFPEVNSDKVKLSKMIRDIFSSSRCILAQRNSDGKVELYDQFGIDHPKADKITFEGREEAYQNQLIARAESSEHQIYDHSIVDYNLVDLESVIFYPYDLEPLRSFIGGTRTEVSNHLTHEIPELGIIAPTVSGETAIIEW